MQYDPPSTQLLFLQRCEQHSLSLPHELPAVLHELLSGVQVVPLHLPLQQAAVLPSVAQAALSEMHC